MSATESQAQPEPLHLFNSFIAVGIRPAQRTIRGACPAAASSWDLSGYLPQVRVNVSDDTAGCCLRCAPPPPISSGVLLLSASTPALSRCRPLARVSSGPIGGSGHHRDAELHDIHEDDGMPAAWGEARPPRPPSTVELTRTHSAGLDGGHLGRRSAGPAAGAQQVRPLQCPSVS